jgi:hypothetical protein
VDTSGTLRSAIQPLIGPWFPWLPPGSLMAGTPDNAISVAPIQLSNGSEMIFMVDAGNVLYANAQTSSGDWNPCVTWSGAPPLRAVAAVKQGGSRGPQLWVDVPAVAGRRLVRLVWRVEQLSRSVDLGLGRAAE